MNFKKDRAEWFLVLLAVCLASAVLAQSTVPTITAIRAEGTNCVVTVSIPEGMQRVTLETSDRAGRLSWLPRAVVRPDLKAGVATFCLPMVRTMELIRVRADLTEPVPGTFFLGTNSFSDPSDNSTRGTFDSLTRPRGHTKRTGRRLGAHVPW